MLSAARRQALRTRTRYGGADIQRRARYSSKPSEGTEPKKAGPKVYEYKKPEPVPETRLATYLKSSPRAMSIFTSVINTLGMGNPRQVGGRVTYHYYQETCAVRELEEREFWHKGTPIFYIGILTHVISAYTPYRVSPTAYLSNLVYGDEFACLAPYCPTPCSSSPLWRKLRTRYASLLSAFD